MTKFLIFAIAALICIITGDGGTVLLVRHRRNFAFCFKCQTPQEKAELMKLLTIELLFDGANLIITPHSAFSALLNLRKSHNLETVGLEPTSKMDQHKSLRV